tara:strand:- start:100873 stop:101190 length:318 start_codon:yes stop_codon:yes gene_type:complete
MSSYAVVFTTMPDKSKAKDLAKYLVTNKLAACVNILQNATSVYEWEGELVEESETVLIVKTRTDMVEKVMIDIRHHHPYEIPALYSFTVDKGDEGYMSWVDKQLL